MIKLSQIIILNVPKREREGKYLKKLIETSTKPYGIPVSISMDRGKGLWDNYSQALTQEVAEGTHRMIIHDDITFDRNILAKILHILSFAPETMLSVSTILQMVTILIVTQRASTLFLQRLTSGCRLAYIQMTWPRTLLKLQTR